MTEFVESATLRVKDQSTKQVRRINAELKKLHETSRSLRSMRLSISGMDRANRDVRELSGLLRALPKSRSIGLKLTTPANIATLERRILDLQTTPDVSIRFNMPGLNDAVADTTTLRNNLNALAKRKSISTDVRTRQTVTSPDQARTLGGTMATGFIAAMNPHRAGGTIARGFLASIGGELFQGVRQATVTATNAPLNRQDVEQRFTASRPEETASADLTLVSRLAEQFTAQFPQTTEAAIIDGSVEAVARIGDIQSPEGQKQLAVVLERIAKNTAVFTGVLGINATAAGDQARLVEGVISQVGATLDPQAAERIADAVVRGVQGSGGDLNASDAKRTVQQLGSLRSELSNATLLQAMLARDESGARGSGELRQIYEDAVRGNLNDDDFATQVDQGLRDTQGRSTIANGLKTDFLATVGDEIIPRLEKLGIDLTDAAAVQNAIDVQLGFSKQGGIATLTDAVVNFSERMAEFERGMQLRPEVFIEDPTVRQRAGALNAQFQNVASEALEPLLPVAERALGGLTESLSAINTEGASLTDYAKVAGTAGAAAIPLAMSTALQGLGDAESRPLSSAALGLTGSAVALNTAATALTGAALVQSKNDGLIKRGLKLLAPVGGAVIGGGGLLTDLTGANAGDGSLTPEAQDFGRLPIDVQQQVIDLEAAGKMTEAAELLEAAVAELPALPPQLRPDYTPDYRDPSVIRSEITKIEAAIRRNNQPQNPRAFPRAQAEVQSKNNALEAQLTNRRSELEQAVAAIEADRAIMAEALSAEFGANTAAQNEALAQHADQINNGSLTAALDRNTEALERNSASQAVVPPVAGNPTLSAPLNTGVSVPN